jgi:hypothetical protein
VRGDLLRDYLRALEAVQADPAVVLWSLAAEHVADIDRLADLAPRLAAASGGARVPVPLIPSTVEVSSLLGQAYEWLSTPADRRRRGMHFTPPNTARHLAALALERAPERPTICDLACGAGALLLAALEVQSIPPDERASAVATVFGADIDPLAAAAAQASLALWAHAPFDNIVVGDSLAGPVLFAGQPRDGFDVVIGNPPFLSQLNSRTARDASARAGLVERYGPLASGYADTAAVFFAAGMAAATRGGTVAMLQPESMLAARDAVAMREHVRSQGRLDAVWIPGERLFDAEVRVCAPVVTVGSGAVPVDVTVFGGVVPEAAGCCHVAELTGTWAPLVAEVRGVPRLDLAPHPRVLGDLAVCVSDFRDQYYGLVPFVREGSPSRDTPAVITVGLIDVGGCSWGRRPATIGKIRYVHPVVDLMELSAANPHLGEWAARRLVPKVVVATQTKVVEAAVDSAGAWLPSVPTISVVPHHVADLYRIAAVLLHPVTSVWAARAGLGSGLSGGTVRMRPRQLAGLPLPTDERAWDECAGLIEAGEIARAAAIDLYGQVNQPVVESWWRAQAGL